MEFFSLLEWKIIKLVPYEFSLIDIVCSHLKKMKSHKWADTIIVKILLCEMSLEAGTWLTHLAFIMIIVKHYLFDSETTIFILLLKLWLIDMTIFLLLDGSDVIGTNLKKSFENYPIHESSHRTSLWEKSRIFNPTVNLNATSTFHSLYISISP